MEIAVHVDGLRYSYGPRLALDGVSFDVARGERHGLLGPNGCGKTTLFRILSTLLPPAGGRAEIFGHDVGEARAAVRRSIGVVFQSPSLDVHLTVRENLLHSGHLYGLRSWDLDTRINDNLSHFEVSDRAHERVKSLSGGLRRRVELAKCLLHRPPLLIMDEPASGLDPVARRALWDHLDRLRRNGGPTILFTTHDLEEAARCDRLIILDRGRVVASGRPGDLIEEAGQTRITIETDDPPALSRSIADQFGVTPTLIGGTLRIFEDCGPDFPAALLRDFGPLIKSLTVARPTLDDVFLRMTGHAFEAEAAA